MRVILVLCLGIVVLTDSALESQVRLRRTPTVSDGSPLSENCHPRMFITCGTTSNLASLQARLTDAGATGYETEFQSFVTNVVNPLIGDPDPSDEARYEETIACAFVYATYPVSGIDYGGMTAADYGGRARTLMLAIVAEAYGDNLGTVYTRILTTLAYDWVWPLLSSGDKTTIVNHHKEVDNPAVFGSCCTASSTSVANSQVTQARTTKALAQMACYGDGVDSWCTLADADWDTMFRTANSYPDVANYIGGDDGEALQGSVYDYVYSSPAFFLAEEGYRTAHGLSTAAHYGSADAQYLQNYVTDVTYRILPFAPVQGGYPGGRRWIWWKSPFEGALRDINIQREIRLSIMFSKHVNNGVDADRAALAQWTQENRVSAPAVTASTTMSYWVFAFMVDSKAITAQSPATLGLATSKAFDSGRFFFRSGFDSQSDTLITFGAVEWQTNSDFSGPATKNGHFDVYRKGPMVINRGSDSSGHTWHFWGSRNTVAFPDRTITAPADQYDNYGDVRNNGTSNTTTANYTQGAVTDFRDTLRSSLASGDRDVDYVMADLTRSYDMDTVTNGGGVNPIRISEYVRHFVFFRPVTPGTDPDRVIVWDRGTTVSTDFEPTLLINPPGVDVNVTGHSASSAGVASNGSTGLNRNSTTHCWTSYTGATTLDWTNTAHGSDGKAVVRLWRPSSLYVNKGGGVSEDSNWRDATGPNYSCEYVDLYGIRWGSGYRLGDVTHSSETDLHSSWYHFEVVPQTIATGFDFLTSYEFGDSGFTASTSEAMTSTTSVYGARVGNRIAVFGATSDSITSWTFTIPTAGTYRMLIAGVNPSVSREMTCSACSTLTQIDPDDASSPFTFSAAGEAYFDIVTTGNNAVITGS